jgi:hypothetical protein
VPPDRVLAYFPLRYMGSALYGEFNGPSGPWSDSQGVSLEQLRVHVFCPQDGVALGDAGAAGSPTSARAPDCRLVRQNPAPPEAASAHRPSP